MRPAPLKAPCLALWKFATSGRYGAQVSSAGWRLTFKPTSLHKGSYTFFVYAHSVVTGKEDLETVGFNIVENS